MSKPQRFDAGDGSTVSLNSMQLYALLNLPPQAVSWPTYWAPRRRDLVTASDAGTKTELTARGRAVLADYQGRRHGR